MNEAMLFDVPANPSHPARYTTVLLPVMAGMLRGRRRILDIFGGVGGVFALEHWLGRGETRLRGAFDSVGDAAAKLLRGEQAAVAGSDAVALRELMTGKTVRGEVARGEVAR